MTTPQSDSAAGAPALDLDNAHEHIAAATSLAVLERLRVGLLGRQGLITAQLRQLGGMSPEQRKQHGGRINRLKTQLQEQLAARKAELEAGELDRRLAGERIDVTLPGRNPATGGVHPLTRTLERIVDIFSRFGYDVVEGPEIEDDWHNFTALNMPESHPARAMHDTFYFPHQDHAQRHTDGPQGHRTLLRTHTSPVQVRTMLSVVEKNGGGTPIRIIAPGRVYRSDSDATHTPMFHQVEGLVIDRDIHLGHLKWTLETFLKAFFEREDIVLRLRPSYFPFTEPSVEVDVGFAIENGKRVLGGSGDAPGHGWMELLGSGMVNRRVIEMSGLDPDEWQGFAFGVGVDRLAMLKYGMDDLRAFFDGDVRWLRHYGFSAFDQPTLSGGVGARA